MEKRLFSLWLAVLILTTMAGCGKKTATPKEPNEVILQTEPVIQLDCFAASGMDADIADAGSSRVAILSERIPSDGGQDGDTEMTFYLVDLKKNRIVSQKEGMAFNDLIAVGKNGEPIGWNYRDSALCIYDDALTLRHTLPLNNAGVLVFDRKEQCVIGLEGETLIRVGLDGKKQELLSLPGVVNTAAYDPENGIILLQDGNTKENRLIKNEFTAYSIRKKRVLYHVDADSALTFSDRAAWFGSSIIKPGENEISDAYVQLCDPASGKIKKVYRLSPDGYISEMGEAGFALWAHYCFDMDEKPTYQMLDLNNGKATDWSIGEEADQFSRGVFVNGGKNLACLTEDGDGNQKLFLIAPDLLTYGDTLKEVGEPLKEEPIRLSDAFSQERELADKIEKKFSVRILLGEPCEIAKDIFAYDFTLTDGTNANRRAPLNQALQMIESVLSLYPEGFFEKFKNYRDVGGVRFFLVDEIINRDGSFVPNGVAHNLDSWYNIALNARSINVRTVHHELWHAVESRIEKADPTLLDPEEWNKLNPPGFEYHNDYDHYSDRNDILSLSLVTNKKDAYFIDTYSAVTVGEDRARLIEEILCDYYDKDFYGEPDPLTLIRHRPRLAAKLAFLEKPVKQIFGSVYWEEIVAKTKYDSNT